MLSNTQTPLASFFKWLGVSPWYAAGIDIHGLHNVNNFPRKEDHQDCTCMLQETWMTDNFTREDFIKAIAYAESIFEQETKTFAKPRYLVEEKSYQTNHRRFLTNSFRPKYYHSLISFNKIVPNFLGRGIVDKTLEQGELPLILNVTFSNINFELEKNIRFYFDTKPPKDYNDYRYEIRGFDRDNISYNSSTQELTVQIPAYLLKKPELQNSEKCLQHEPDTYADEIHLYEWLFTATGGLLKGFEENCFSPNCTEVSSEVCINKYINVDTAYGKPVTSAYLNFDPTSIEFYYLSGFEKDTTEVISKLAIGLTDLVKEYCKCEQLNKKKIEFFRSVPKEKIAARSGDGYNDSQYQILVDANTLNMLDGLLPTVGLIQAMREMKSLNTSNVSGGVI